MQLLQADAITMCRAEADDAVDGKIVNDYKPALGSQDGQNKNFQVPVQRVIVANLQIFKNEILLATPLDYSITNPKFGQFSYVVAPQPSDSFSFNISFTWADDLEVDHYLSRAANELGFYSYHSDVATVAGSEVARDTSNNPLPLSDFPSGLTAALIYGGAYKYANALSSRFAQKYDIGAGDKNYSASQMAVAYEKMAERLNKQFLNARDDYYKGQGRQYRASIATTGYILPNWTPRR